MRSLPAVAVARMVTATRSCQPVPLPAPSADPRRVHGPDFTDAPGWLAAVERSLAGRPRPEAGPSADEMIAVAQAEATAASGDGSTETTVRALADLTGLKTNTVSRVRLALTELQLEVLLEPARASGNARRHLQIPPHLQGASRGEMEPGGQSSDS